MDYIKLLREREKELKQAGENYEEARVQAQISCEHPKIVEGNYLPPSSVSNGYAPFRVCRDCGYSEEGWGSGYSFLTRGDKQDELEIPTIDRGRAYEFRRGQTLDNEVHRAVLNGKKKLEEVLREHRAGYLGG
jgi:hypothetical protein